MSSYDIQSFVTFINERWKGRHCPMCNAANWSVDDTVYTFVEYDPTAGLKVGGGLIVPIIPITCGACGYVVLINAIISGALKIEPVASEEITAHDANSSGA